GALPGERVRVPAVSRHARVDAPGLDWPVRGTAAPRLHGRGSDRRRRRRGHARPGRVQLLGQHSVRGGQRGGGTSAAGGAVTSTVRTGGAGKSELSQAVVRAARASESYVSSVWVASTPRPATKATSSACTAVA